MAAINSVADDATDARLRWDVIDDLRKAQKISKGALAIHAGVDYSTFWRYSRGKGNAPLAVAKRIADRLGVTVDDLTGNDPMAVSRAAAVEVARRVVDALGVSLDALAGNPTQPPPSGPPNDPPPSGPKADR